MTNPGFLQMIKSSFETYLRVGTSRSTAKLKTLHGQIAKDLQELLGDDFVIASQGYGAGKEGLIGGRYYPKKVDITISKNGVPVAGYAIKFVMRNYSQNSNNYFENMLGETANIRAANIPYFQIFIIFDKLPYYENDGSFKRFETITAHHIEKYLVLSRDNPSVFFHTPNKTLVALIKLKESRPDIAFASYKDYNGYYKDLLCDPELMSFSNSIPDSFGDSVILNNYEDFIKRTYHIIMGSLKE